MQRIIRTTLIVVASVALAGPFGYWFAKRPEIQRGQLMNGTQETQMGIGVEPSTRFDELIEDKNQDGVADEWGIKIDYLGEYPGMYHVEDLDFDGTLDRVSLSMDSGKSFIAIVDSDRDGVMDRRAIALQSQSGNFTSIRYFDLDLDGVIDTMSKYVGEEPSEYYVRLGNVWTRAGRKGSDPREIALIKIDDEVVRVEFYDGEWNRTSSL